MPSGTRESGGGVPTPGACASASSKAIRGFTLIELMITIAIAAILLSVAVPSYRAVIQNSRASALATNLTAAINTARSEAVKRSEPVRVCPSSNGTSCTGTWEDGWIVLLDSTNEVLQQWQGLDDSAIITQTPNDDTALVFNRIGGLDSPDTSLQASTADCTGNRARLINISPTGRQRITRVDCP